VPEIAVVGGGLMGCLAGIRLARAGNNVTLIERRARLLEGASRRNEGKIHRGYTYGLDPTGETGRILARHGTEFAPLLAEVIGARAAEIYLHERQWYALPSTSALDVARAERHIHTIARLDPEHGLDGIVRMDERELHRRFCDDIVAAFEVPEASIDCPLLCELVRAAAGNERIVLHTDVEVGTIEDGDRPSVRTAAGDELGAFDVVVNAAWDGMPAIEHRAGAMQHPLCLRAKVGFVTRVTGPVPDRAVTFVYGPFGDIVPQRDGTAYVSWYPSALMAMTTDVSAGSAWFDSVAANFDFRRCYEENCAAFARLMPGLAFAPEPLEVRAGPILAAGETDISDPQSKLHGRAKLGFYRRGRVIAINTGKLTSAPSLAAELSRMLA
jgi:glycine/D-amino acid oxidase-like deaminating enzyme